MRDFRVFNSAVEFYRLSRSLKLSAELKDQLKRAASSIALNLAEGRAKSTYSDRLKYFHIAMGSARECLAIMILSDFESSEAWKKLDILAAQIFCLIRGVKR